MDKDYIPLVHPARNSSQERSGTPETLRSAPHRNHPTPRRAKGGFISSAKKLLIGLAIGLIVGIVGTIGIMNAGNQPQEPHVTPSVVFDRVVAQNEMVCASQTYNITDKSTQDPARFFDLFDIPFTDTSFWYRYVGTIKVGVDLEKATMEHSDGEAITITLDQPYIISNTPDMEASGVLEEHDNLFAHVSAEDVDNFQRECIRVSEEGATGGSLMEEARTNAQTNLSNMFKAALGDNYQVTVNWRESEEA